MSPKLILLFILSLVPVVIADAQAQPIPTPTNQKTYYFELTAREIAALEAKLKTKPDDSEARIRLVNYYAERETAADKKSLQRHRLALIENNAQSDYSLPLGLWTEDDWQTPEYLQLKNAWLKRISLDKQNKRVRFNAAYFLSGEKALAEKILLDGKILAPADSDYPAELVEFYENSMSVNYGESEETRLNKRLAVLKKIIAEAQTALGLLKKSEDAETVADEIRKMLVASAKYALETGDLALAKKSAEEIITESGEPQSLTSGFGDSGIESFQIANSVLGRIALRAGNVEKAREYLMNAILLIDDESNIHPKLDAPFLEEMLVRNGSKNVLEYLESFLKSKHLEDSDKATVKEIILLLNRGTLPIFSDYLSIY